MAKNSLLESKLISAERVLSFTQLEAEPGYSVEANPRSTWPESGSIKFKDVSLTYYPGGRRCYTGSALTLHQERRLASWEELERELVFGSSCNVPNAKP